MSAHTDDYAHFKTFRAIRPPLLVRTIAALMMIGLTLTLLFMAFVPWVQTAYGQGRITALEPRDRIQDVNALVSGRIDWFVIEGQAVSEGDLIARIVDNDPQVVERLQAERAQLEAEAEAAALQIRVAGRDVDRMRMLVREGLSAPQELERAQLRVADYRTSLAQVRARLQEMDLRINRQQAQEVRAPRDGVVQQILAGDTATYVQAGDVLMSFAPETTNAVAEIFVDGVDVPLVTVGRRVRLEFEGWPAVQFSGWPSVARGIFDGVVFSVDQAPSANGLYRVLVAPAADRPSWPAEPAVRLGAKVRGWVLMDTVTVGFEIWRQLNNFPLQFNQGAEAQLQQAPASADIGGKAG